MAKCRLGVEPLFIIIMIIWFSESCSQTPDCYNNCGCGSRCCIVAEPIDNRCSHVYEPHSFDVAIALVLSLLTIVSKCQKMFSADFITDYSQRDEY